MKAKRTDMVKVLERKETEGTPNYAVALPSVHLLLFSRFFILCAPAKSKATVQSKSWKRNDTSWAGGWEILKIRAYQELSIKYETNNKMTYFEQHAKKF